MSATARVASPAPVPSPTPAAARPDIVGIRVDTERGPIGHTTFDRVSVLREPLQWQYDHQRINASHETIDQTWDGPYAQPKDATDWTAATSAPTGAAKAAVEHLFDLATTRAGELDGAPHDARTTSEGGSMTVTLLLRNADQALPATHAFAWKDMVTGPGAGSVQQVSWGANDDLFTPQALRDITEAARAVQAATKPATAG